MIVEKLPTCIKGFQRYRMHHNTKNHSIEFFIKNEDLLSDTINAYEIVCEENRKILYGEVD